jgi:hypothetical protein
MPTYFSINDGFFNTSSVFAATLSAGDVTAGTVGNLLTTTFSYPTTLATSNGSTYCGIALQLSAVNGSPTGTVDLILSGSNGSSTGTVSFPVSGLTQFTSHSNITPGHPQGWQYFTLPTPISFPNSTTMQVGVKTSVANKVSLIGTALTNLNRHYVTTTNGVPVNADVVHIVGNLNNTELIPRVVEYNVEGLSLGNFYVHNGGTLNFHTIVNTTLTLTGANGMQITPNGTVNIGTSANPIAADKVHTINLNNCFINVHNGASLNTYGSYKTPFALLSASTVAGATSYPLTTNVSNWISNSVATSGADFLVITPNTTTITTFDTTSARSITSNVLSAWSAASFSHVASDYIPSVVNMTRNVRFTGTNTTFGYIRFLDGSVSNLNNTQFRGLRNSTYKGLQFGTNSSGSVSLSNCAFNGDGVASTPPFSFESTKSPTSNVSIRGCNFFGYGASTDIISLNALSTNNFTFTDNIVLNASQNGMLINGLSSTYANIKNNFLIGSTQNGLHVTNPYLVSGTIGGIGCMNGGCGSVVAGTNNRANYDGLAGHYNTLEGVNILGTIPQLSSTIFSNITANNNRTVGLELSANSNNLSSPIRVNINGVVANNNGDAGFEGYAITGNLSSMTLNNNVGYGVKTTLGNSTTIFDGVTSEGTSLGGNTLIKTGSLPLSSASPFGVGTDSSIFFANPNYITVPSNNLNSDSNDFTIECWFRVNASGSYYTIFSFGDYRHDNGWLCRVEAGGTGDMYNNSAGVANWGAVSINQWHHLAMCRVSGSTRVYLNGTLRTTVTINSSSTLRDLYIGTSPHTGLGNEGLNGFISNFRIVKGTAVYTANFTVPTAPLSLIPNTTLLYNDPYGTVYKDSNSSACAFGILSAQSYFPTVIKSAKLISSTLSANNGSALLLDSSKLEQFVMESSTLSSYRDIMTLTSRNLIEGSYQFNNCTFNTGILSSNLESYQPEVFAENGFVVMKENGVANRHYKLVRAGKISLDETLTYGSDTISEKLEPTSATIKLRSGSKMVPVNKGKSYEIRCYVRKSSGYTGAAPRLILKRNTALGYQDTVLDTSTEANGTWELLTGVIPPALDAGIFEVYVDCSGARESGSVNIISWNLV